MARVKKILDQAFRRAITNALRGRSPFTVEKASDLPHQAIKRVLDGTNPELSRAIEIASALGFELRCEWEHNSRRDMEARTLAARLVLHEMRAWPEFVDIVNQPNIRLFAKAFERALAEVQRRLSVSETGEPHVVFAALLADLEAVAGPESADLQRDLEAAAGPDAPEPEHLTTADRLRRIEQMQAEIHRRPRPPKADD